MAELRCQIKRKSAYTYDEVYPRTKGEYNTFDNSGTDIVATNCQDAITELYGRIDSGKTPLANAITTMGQTTLSSATYSQMATNILNISDDADAVVGNVLTGKTFYQGGSKKTGTMVNNTTVSGTIGGLNSSNPTVPVRVGTNQNVSTQTVDGVTRLCYKSPQGYYDGNGYVGVAQADVASTIGLTAGKIVSGNTILGVSGSAVLSLKGTVNWTTAGQFFDINLGFTPKNINIVISANNGVYDYIYESNYDYYTNYNKYISSFTSNPSSVSISSSFYNIGDETNENINIHNIFVYGAFRFYAPNVPPNGTTIIHWSAQP